MAKVGKNRIEISIKEVEAHARDGLTMRQMCECMGIGYSTWFERKEKEPELADAYKKGKQSANKEVANALFTAATNGNITAAIFWLKVKAGWKEADSLLVDEETGEKKTYKTEVTIAGNEAN